MSEQIATDLTILVVDDFEDTRFVMRLDLEQRGYHVIEAADGKTAVALALREHPDIILMDLSLPYIDGFEAAKLIRADEEMLNVVIIAVTAHMESNFRQGAKASGFDAYVTKPIDMDWLSELISGLKS